MGNTYPTQNVYKICMECKKQNKINDNIKMLNSYSVEYNYSLKYTFMCSYGHIFKYKLHTHEEKSIINKYFTDLEQSKNKISERNSDSIEEGYKISEYFNDVKQISKLKDENAKLNEEIKTMQKKLNEQKINASNISSEDFKYESQILVLAHAVLIEGDKTTNEIYIPK